MQGTEMKFLRGFKQCTQCDQIKYMYIKQELNISSVMDNNIYNKDNWTQKEGRQAPSNVTASPLQHLVQSVLYGIIVYIVFTVFIHSATNVTLDITFTSYITFLTYKHY